MRIFSKFRDYYDCIAGAVGFDPTIIYNRELRHEEYMEPIGCSMIYTTNGFHALSLEVYKFLICGKEYTIIEASHTCGELGEVEYCTSKKEVERFLEKYNQNVKHEIRIDNRYGFNIDRLLEQWFSDKDIEKLHIKYNSPILSIYEENFYCGKKIIEVNTKLDEFNFAKIIEPYVLFQEIEMYLGNVLCNVENGDVQISDKDMIKQKGFNDASFRKQPVPKGKKKRPKYI